LSESSRRWRASERMTRLSGRKTRDPTFSDLSTAQNLRETS
jgi:hypothetical protein